MKYLLICILLAVKFTSHGQNSSNNWKVYLNKDTIPLKLYQDTTLLIHLTNPDTDYLTFIKIAGEPAKGKIQFVEGKGIPSGMNYPLPLAKYKLNEPTTIYLKDIAKNFKNKYVNGLIVQLLEISQRTIRPIVYVKFQKSN
jgi:hypothetical protein